MRHGRDATISVRELHAGLLVLVGWNAAMAFNFALEGSWVSAAVVLLCAVCGLVGSWGYATKESES